MHSAFFACTIERGSFYVHSITHSHPCRGEYFMVKITRAGSQAGDFWSFSESPLRLPEKATWENMSVEHHRLSPPGECQKHYQQHRVRIALQYILLERR